MRNNADDLQALIRSRQAQQAQQPQIQTQQNPGWPQDPAAQTQQGSIFLQGSPTPIHLGPRTTQGGQGWMSGMTDDQVSSLAKQIPGMPQPAVGGQLVAQNETPNLWRFSDTVEERDRPQAQVATAPQAPVAGLGSFLPQFTMEDLKKYQAPGQQAQPQPKDSGSPQTVDAAYNREIMRQVLADPELRARAQQIVPAGNGTITLGPPGQRGPITVGPPAQQGQVPMPTQSQMKLQPGPEHKDIVEQLLDKRYGKEAPAGDLGYWQRDRDNFVAQLTMTPQDWAREHWSLSQSWGPEIADLAMQAGKANQNMMMDLLGRDRQNDVRFAEEGGRRFGTVLNASNAAEQNRLVGEQNTWERSPQGLMRSALLEQLKTGRGIDTAAIGQQIKQLESLGFPSPQARGNLAPQGQPQALPVPEKPYQKPVAQQMEDALSQDEKGNGNNADGRAMLASLEGPRDEKGNLIKPVSGKELIQKLRKLKGDAWIRANKPVVRAWLEQSHSYGEGSAKDDATAHVAQQIFSTPLRIAANVPLQMASVPYFWAAPFTDNPWETVKQSPQGINWNYTLPMTERYEKMFHTRDHVTDEQMTRELFGLE